MEFASEALLFRVGNMPQ